MGHSPPPAASVVPDRIQWTSLLRARLRAMVPLGSFLIFGYCIFLFFSTIVPPSPDLASSVNSDRVRLVHHPHSRPDSFGQPGHPDSKGWLPHVTSPALEPVSLNQDDFSAEELMRLPILHHTASDPFDPINDFKPMRDSRSPWVKNTPSGDLLISQLSLNRFPGPEAPDPYAGSTPPPTPVWPRASILHPRDLKLRHPIPISKIHGVNASYTWLDREVNEKLNISKVQWSGFGHPNWESDSDRVVREHRQGWVRRAFQHVWEGYKAKAWGHDELKPISGSFNDPFSGWGAALVDCLDTLLILNLTREYDYARTHVNALDWSHTINAETIKEVNSPTGSELVFASPPPQPTVPFFETVIRYVGGLISAYDLSGDKLMLERAEELAEWLLPAFGTSTGFPVLRYQMGSNPDGASSGRACLAEVGSLTLEFTRLAQLTKKDYYYQLVQRITDVLDGDQWQSSSRPGTLFPTFIDPDHPSSLTGEYTLGGMADSYYEYLIKEHQLLGGTHSQYGRMFSSAIDSVRTHLVKQYQLESSEGKSLTVIGDLVWGNYKPNLDHLTCFSGAMIGLGSRLLNRTDMDLALGHTDACVWAYESTPTGVGPERVTLMEGDEHTKWSPVEYKGRVYRELKREAMRGAKIIDGRYLGRPETIESVFYMWRITGDRQWQDRGWRMFTNWMEACISEFGFADLKEVGTFPAAQSDKEESFVLAETLKYYYLLFSEPDLISLDDYVLNTEAHPFRLPEQVAGSDTKGKGKYKMEWKGPNPDIERRYAPYLSVRSDDSTQGRGYGTFLQQWSRVNYEKMSPADIAALKTVFELSQ